jgi:MFS family permease
MGIACGLDLTSIPLYVREVSPDSLSGHTGSIMQANISLGLFLGFIITMPLTNITENNQSADGLWRLVFLIPIVFSLLRITSFLLIYKKDTPYFYFSQRRIAEGRAALEEIYLPEFVFD